MKKFQSVVCQSALIAVLGVGVSAEPFTYQGQLQDDGQQANGEFDFIFTLFDAAANGGQVGLVVQHDDISISDGLVQVEVDFGTEFDGANRWIQVAVRDGNSGGGYTTLLPRQQMFAVPEAQHALVADTVIDAQWGEAPGILTYGDGLGKVFINRAGPLTLGEFFGVHADEPGFVGMYVSGPTGAQPFYGYSVAGQVSAYTYFDQAMDSWILIKGGQTAMSIDSANDTSFVEDVTADAFRFTNPVAKSYALTFANFQPNTFSAPFRMDILLGTFFENGAYSMFAPVNLPDGAVVTSMTVQGQDFAAGNIEFNLVEVSKASGSFSFNMASIATSGSGGSFDLVDNSVSFATIDNSVNGYAVIASSSNWGGINLVLKSVTIEYTIDQAD